MEIIHGERFVDLCRKYGWGPGTVIQRENDYYKERLIITAVGHESALVATVNLARDDIVDVIEGTERVISHVDTWRIIGKTEGEVTGVQTEPEGAREAEEAHPAEAPGGDRKEAARDLPAPHRRG